MGMKILGLRWAAAAAALLFVIVSGTGLTAPAAAGEREAVLAANAEFYRAFRESDMDAMRAIWGEQEPVAVEHPSTWRVEGRAGVLRSWEVILTNPPAIRCAVQSANIRGGIGEVICVEHLDPGTVTMINRFRREGGQWKIIYHGPAPKSPVA